MSNPAGSRAAPRATASALGSPALYTLRRSIAVLERDIIQKDGSFSRWANHSETIIQRQEMNNRLQRLRGEEAEMVQKLRLEQDMKKLSLAAKGHTGSKTAAEASTPVGDDAELPKATSEPRRLDQDVRTREQKAVSRDIMTLARAYGKDVRTLPTVQVVLYRISEKDQEVAAAASIPDGCKVSTTSEILASSHVPTQAAVTTRSSGYCACVQQPQKSTLDEYKFRGEVQATRVEALRSLELVLKELREHGQKGR